jgi:hypothetical protein
MARCQVRCANCHRRKTARAANWFRARRGSPDVGDEAFAGAGVGGVSGA